MTEEERKMLHETHEMTKNLNAALMEPTATGEPPLIVRVGAVVVAVERSNWAVKWGFRIIVGLGALAGAFVTIRNGVGK